MTARSAPRDDHSFLVLHENRLAYAAIEQLVSAGKSGPCPSVTLYGPSGTGKSHLVRHAVRVLRSHSSDERIASLSAAQFADELAAASAGKTLPQFVRKYRAPWGLFICEDLQAIDRRLETQDQLVSLWNDLVTRNCRILVTVDRPPGELRGLPARLTNRIQGGVCVGLARYGPVSREKLLTHLADSAQLPLSDEQIRRLARSAASNGHEVMGVMSSIRHRLRTRPAEGLTAVIDQLLDEQPDIRAPSLNEIARAVAREFGIRVSDLRSDARDRRLAIPRQVAMLLMRDVGQAQYRQIGEYFGGRTHSTVLHGCRRISDQLQNDQLLKLQFDQVRRRLRRTVKSQR